MIIDHIFILTDDSGKIADELVDFGFTEGSNHIHAGQGTTNRKFYFENFFLEILWVHNIKELKSKQTKPTGLWRRAEFNTTHFTPFGLCMVHSEETDVLFKNALKYQPDYFPEGMLIDILKNEQQPCLPWTFRLPFKGQNKNDKEPKVHLNKIKALSKAIFEFQNCTDQKFLKNFEALNTIQFISSGRNWLNLIFDDGKQGKTKEFKNLCLTIEY